MAGKCTETNARGEPCGMNPPEGSDKCWAHDPARRREAQAARKLGGLRRRRPKAGTAEVEGVELRNLEDIRGLLGRVIQDTLALETGVQRSRALAYLIGQAIKLHEVGELAEEIAAIRRQLGMDPAEA